MLQATSPRGLGLDRPLTSAGSTHRPPTKTSACWYRTTAYTARCRLASRRNRHDLTSSVQEGTRRRRHRRADVPAAARLDGHSMIAFPARDGRLWVNRLNDLHASLIRRRSLEHRFSCPASHRASFFMTGATPCPSSPSKPPTACHTTDSAPTMPLRPRRPAASPSRTRTGRANCRTTSARAPLHHKHLERHRLRL